MKTAMTDSGLKERLYLKSPKWNLISFCFHQEVSLNFYNEVSCQDPLVSVTRSSGSASSIKVPALLPAQASQPALPQGVLSGCIVPCVWLQGLCVSKWPSHGGTDKPCWDTWPCLSVMLQRYPCKYSPDSLLLLCSTSWAAWTVQKNRTLQGTFNSQAHCYWKPSFIKNLWNSQTKNRCAFLKVLLLKG